MLTPCYGTLRTFVGTHPKSRKEFAMDEQNITARIEALETAINTQWATLRRQRLIIGGLVLAVVGAVVMGAAPQSGL